ncbi:MAG: Gx transporter family protein [Lachnospiraceae bacterium]|nr:Gx transporter family protein [Lachnospiraceae bacterium]
MRTHTDKRKKTYHIAALGLLAAMSLGIYVLESLLPPLLPVPGIKPGLSNIITLFALRRFGKKEAGIVLLVRILLSALLFGNAISLVYSLLGGAAALCIEIITDSILKGRLLYLTGAFGGLFHNAGQLASAFIIMKTAAVLTYSPYLAIAGIITGFFTGLCAYYLLKIRIPGADEIM